MEKPTKKIVKQRTSQKQKNNLSYYNIGILIAMYCYNSLIYYKKGKDPIVGKTTEFIKINSIIKDGKLEDIGNFLELKRQHFEQNFESKKSTFSTYWENKQKWIRIHYNENKLKEFGCILKIPEKFFKTKVGYEDGFQFSITIPEICILEKQDCEKLYQPIYDYIRSEEVTQNGNKIEQGSLINVVLKIFPEKFLKQ